MSEIKLPRIVRGDRVLEEFSRDVRLAIQALTDRETHRQAHRPQLRPFRCIPQGDDTVRIGKGYFIWWAGTDAQMNGEVLEKTLSSPITVTDGQTVWADLTFDPDYDITATTTSGSGDTVTSYVAGLANSTVTYTARSATPTAGTGEFDDAAGNFTLSVPIAKVKVASSVATVDIQYVNGPIFIPYVNWTAHSS